MKMQIRKRLLTTAIALLAADTSAEGLRPVMTVAVQGLSK
jgi:hypothetical protein